MSTQALRTDVKSAVTMKEVAEWQAGSSDSKDQQPHYDRSPITEHQVASLLPG